MDNFQRSKIHVAQSFWTTPIDYDNRTLNINKSPTIILEDAPFLKIHFLFIMLNVNTLFVVKQGILKGFITKIEFIKKRKIQDNSKSKIKNDRELLKEENLL